MRKNNSLKDQTKFFVLVFWVAVSRIQVKNIDLVLYEKRVSLHHFGSSEVSGMQKTLSIVEMKVNQSCPRAMIGFK